MVEGEGTAITERSMTPSRADASSTLQSASSRLGRHQKRAANYTTVFGLTKNFNRDAPQAFERPGLKMK